MKIPNQVKLPLRVAMGVVTQGLRIRLGRSIVTISGVTCGIAFLMSILTGQLVKQGVVEEDARRDDVSRILSFIRGDLPKLRDKPVQIVGAGSMSEIETRVAEALISDFGVTRLILDPANAPSPVRTLKKSAASGEASVVFVMGEGAPKNFDWKAFQAASLNNVAASTIPSAATAEIKELDSSRLVQLARELTAEDIAIREANARKEKFRSIWIGIVSLLVTVIGISNAMLMSVTERFREIGTMKCLGALSSFVTQMFVLEAAIMGLVGGILGALFGALFATVIYAITYGPELVFAALPVMMVALYAVFSVIVGVVLSILAALYPARVAAAMVPASALRSTV